MAQTTGLGRGLSALLPDSTGGTGFREVPVDLIDPNPRQPRDMFEDDALTVLTDSIRRVGVLQPIVVRSGEGGRFFLIAGERRLRASKIAGRATVPVIIRDASEIETLEQALIENVHRQDLNPLEEAAAFRQLIDDFDLKHEEVAARMGRTRASVTNSLRLLGLPGEVQELVIVRKVTGGHARAILAVDDPDGQVALARRVVDEGLSVRETEKAAKDSAAEAAQRVKPATDAARQDGGSAAKHRHPALLEVGEIMGDYLNTRVTVDMGKGAGKMTIEFGSLADLERITDLILGHEDGREDTQGAT